MLKGTNAKVWGSSTQGNTKCPVLKCGRSQTGIWTVLLDFLADPFLSSMQPSLPYFKDVFSSYAFIIWVFRFSPNHKYFLNRTEIDRLHFFAEEKKRSCKWNFSGMSPDSRQRKSIKSPVMWYPSCQQSGDALKHSSCCSSYNSFKLILGQKPSL